MSTQKREGPTFGIILRGKRRESKWCQEPGAGAGIPFLRLGNSRKEERASQCRSGEQQAVGLYQF